MLSKRSYITVDFNSDLLKINRNIYYNHFYETLTQLVPKPGIAKRFQRTARGYIV